MKLLHGDCLELMKELPDNSVFSIVTDPPYGLKFMGKKWDYDVPSIDIWKEALRVLKPGGHLLSFGGTRTYHRMVVNIEDAGFEIRDQIQWLYGSGFPKSHNISKGIDKKYGAEREVIGVNPSSRPNSKGKGQRGFDGQLGEIESAGIQRLTAPSTDLAKQWEGYGTALKPANEPIVLARKPLSEKTIVDNVLLHGTGGLNIDASRIQGSYNNQGGGSFATGKYKNSNVSDTTKDGLNYIEANNTQGRFPANILLDETAADMLDEQSGILKVGGAQRGSKIKTRNSFHPNDNKGGTNTGKAILNEPLGGASRFFYCAKASKSERNAGLEGMELKQKYSLDRTKSQAHDCFTHGDKNPCIPQANNHPTVKPIKLMQYLVRLVTPPNGTILDPFMGSGTTGIAAKSEGFDFIGIEKDKEYFEIAKNRIYNKD